MPSVAIITANIGNFDTIYVPAKQREEYDLYYYTENNLPFPLPHLNGRLKGKYLKTQSHRFINHDIHIWIDGSVQIIDGTFISVVLDALSGADVVITKHERDGIYDELNYIQQQMRSGSKYLLTRYAREPFDAELRFYRSTKIPVDYPLYNCWFFARRNIKPTNNAFNEWWDMILRYSNFDQTQFSFVAWKHKLNIKTIDVANYLIRHKH